MGKVVTGLNKPNEVRNFYPADDNRELKKFGFIASTAAREEGTAVAWQISSNITTGNLTLMPAVNANGSDFVGILAEPIATTDEDYATAGKLKAVRVPKHGKARAYATVGSGTLTAAMKGSTATFHSDGKSFVAGTYTLGGMRIVEVLTIGAATVGKAIVEFGMSNTATA